VGYGRSNPYPNPSKPHRFTRGFRLPVMIPTCAAAVIPTMDKMHKELTAAAENVEYSPALQATLTLGKNLLNKYYSLSDDSEIYRIATHCYSNHIYLVLHPKHKLKYFEKQNWEEDWVNLGQNSGRLCRRNLSKIMKNISLANQKHLCHPKKRWVSINSLFFHCLDSQESSSPETMTATTQRAHHQAPMRRNSQMSLNVTSHLALSRELTIHSGGGMRTKLFVLLLF
jgi:hypothetical protein